ncbi:hypothetical protein [Crocinitomix algicola]|uniref:hypothetical protein n=1 Tax=Crocinitomix algicola TaxID=1740263 RepID=UPI001C310CBA|nr:hypothetical protein [Crocinitomix algicola]
MKFLESFKKAYANGNTEWLLSAVDNNIIWHIIGKYKIEGEQAFQEYLEKINFEKIKVLEIDQILSHGKEGALNGTIIMQDDSKLHFADFYIFQNTKGTLIKKITTYIL